MAMRINDSYYLKPQEGFEFKAKLVKRGSRVKEMMANLKQKRATFLR